MSRATQPISNRPNNLYEFGPFRLDAAERVLFREDVLVPLAPKAVDLLVELVEKSGRVIAKDELIKAVWPDSFVEEANLSHHIFILRKALGDNKNGSKYIETIPRRGYRFVANVLIIEDNAELLIAEHTRSHIVIEEEQETGVATPERPRAVTALDGELVESRLKLLRKVPVLVFSSVLVIVIGGLLWFWLPRRGSEAVLPPMTIAPFTTYADNEFSPRFSPDGKSIAFCWTGGDPQGGINIFVKQVEGGGQIQLTNNATCRNGAPSWSPDGRFIAFWRGCTDGGKNGLYVVPAVGGSERMLHSGIFVQDLCWSPDGNSIAFAEKSSTEKALNLFLLTVDTLEVRELGSPPAEVHHDRFLSFSPDSRELSFVRASGDFTTDELIVVSISDGKERRLASDNCRIHGADWTADGKEVVFSSNRTGNFGLWRVAASGGVAYPLEVGTENAQAPSISPKGNLLAYTQVYSDSNIYKIDLPGGKAKKAALPAKLIASTRMDRNPRLSPDGKHLAFESNRTGGYEIWIASADGSGEKQLTFFAGPETRSPSWSPDGQQIAFISRAKGRADLYAISIEGLPPQRLSDGSFDCVAPSWSKDGRWIYFGSDRGGSWQVWKMSVDGGEPIQVTGNGGYEAMESPDGRFLYYNKFGFYTEGLFRIPVEGGPETTIFDLPQMDSFGDWTVAEEGIYYVHRYDQYRKLTSHFSINLFDFATGKVTAVAALEKDPVSHPGLNISPDRRSLIYSSNDTFNHDIMLVKNFR